MAMMTESHIERAKTEFFDWWGIKGNKLGQGDYTDAAQKVNEVSKNFFKEDVTLHLQTFRFGFSFYYGEISGQKMIPISWGVGNILRRQITTKDLNWPIKHPENGNYFIPNVTLNLIDSPSGSTPTDDYLQGLVNRPTERNRNILKALTPYLDQIKNCCGEHSILYKKIVQIMT